MATSITRTTRVDLTTAGVAVAYAFGESRPTTGWTHIAGIKSIPSMNEQPAMVDTTTLDELVSHVGVPGLKGLPGSTNFTASFTNVLTKQWADVVTKYKEAVEDGQQMWITIVIPGIDFAFYFTAIPSSLDVPAIGVDAAIDIDLYITPTSEREMTAAPTSISAWSSSSLVD